MSNGSSDRAAAGGRSCRIAVLGSHGAFTACAVDELCRSGVPPVALITREPPAFVQVPGDAPGDASGKRVRIPVEVRAPAVRAAAAHGIARIPARNPNHSDTIAAIERLEPDILLIACLPVVAGRSARRTARLGTLNLHPSALPRYRGPDPVFWQLRDGVRRAGVTVHVATDTVDAGPIVAQREVEAQPGIGAQALTDALVRAGIRALVAELPDIEHRIRDAAPQDHSAATTQPRPGAGDFRLDTSWSAERAYRFIEGVRGSAATFTIGSDEGEIEVERATGFDSALASGPAIRQSGDVATIRFADGTLRAVPARARQGSIRQGSIRQGSMASSSSKPNVDMSRMRDG